MKFIHLKSPMLVVFFKEVLENIRDRRTMINALLIGPLLGPLLFIVLISALTDREVQKSEAPLEVSVIGAQYAPNLIESLRQQGLKIKPAVDDPEKRIHDQDEEVILRIPPDFAQSWNKGETSQVEVLHDSSHRDSGTPVERLRRMLEGYAQRNATMRVVARGLSPSVSTPLIVASRDLSTPQSRGGVIFAMLPYFLIMTLFYGGMYLAIDTTAGERERQSLEPLLVNPVARWKIMVGKLGATFVFAMAALCLSLLTFAFSGKLIPADTLGIQLHLGTYFIVLTLLVMAPLALLITALQTTIAAFAKSYREAQTFLSLLMMIPLIPTMMLAVLPVKPQLWMMSVPLLGQHLLIMKLVRGDVVTTNELGLCLGCGLIVALLACVVAALVYRSERLAISA